jgi:hypothetical protein
MPPSLTRPSHQELKEEAALAILTTNQKSSPTPILGRKSGRKSLTPKDWGNF